MNTLKLNTLEKNILSQKEMNNLNGGNWICNCSCYYEGTPGGSSVEANKNANAEIPGGGHSEKGQTKDSVVVCTP